MYKYILLLLGVAFITWSFMYLFIGYIWPAIINALFGSAYIYGYNKFETLNIKKCQ